jgi:hypothetical protein
MHRAAVAFALTLVAAPVFSAEAPVAIAVAMPAAPAFVDEESQRLIDSTKDLIAELAKRRTVRLEETAAIRIVVTNSAPEPTGTMKTTRVPSAFGGPPTVTTSPDYWRTVHATLTVGDYSVELKGAGQLSWKDAAKDLAGSIEKWIRQNRAKL